MNFAATTWAQFETRGSFGVGLNPPDTPISIAVGDFNQDGNLDLAVALTTRSTQIAVLVGTGDGTFKAPVYYTVGEEPVSVVTADFNRDGRRDLAVANQLGNSISVLLGNGDGTFQPAKDANLLYNPLSIAVGDFNHDEILDLAVADTPYVSVLFGKGDGTFHPPLNMEYRDFVAGVAVGDFNGDGNLDVAACGAGRSDEEVGILLGNGAGSFQPAVYYSVFGLSPDSLATGDFNADGALDLAVGGQGGDLVVLLNKGDGTFQPPVFYPANVPISVAVGDLNGDGKLDIAAATSSSTFTGTATVLLGRGDGTFEAGTVYPTGDQSNFLALGDFNRDRKTDIIIADTDDLVVELLNTGVVSFSPTSPLKFPAQLVGGSSNPKSISLTNTGASPLSISSITVRDDFQLSTTCKKKVAPGAKCALNVTFTPQTKDRTTERFLFPIVHRLNRRSSNCRARGRW